MKIKRSTKEKLIGLLFVSPWILGFIVFTLYPLIQSIVYSFSKVRFFPNGKVDITNVGMNNYVKLLFNDPEFLLQIPNFLKDMFFSVPMVVIFSVLLAILLNTKIKFRRVFRALFFLPVIIISGPVLAKLEEFGATTINDVENFFVYTYISESLPNFLSTPVLYAFSNVILFLWFSGVQILIILSSLQKVDHAVYEASTVDGASKWQQFFKLTLPTLKPFIFVISIYTIVDVSNSGLNPFIGIIKNSMYQDIKGFGYSAAATWIYFFLILAIVIVAYLLLGISEEQIDNRRMKKNSNYEKQRDVKIRKQQIKYNKYVDKNMRKKGE
jgi:ABC-type sugar transport system permease subunit